MDKSFMKQQRFSFRKMKVGLASVAILFAFAQVGQVSADETTKPASTSTETVKKTEASKSAVETAVAEIKADEAKPVVNKSDAKPGELVDVSKTVSPIDMKERQEGDQKIHEETATVEVTKTEVAPVKSEELPAPKTEKTESTVSGKDEDGNSYTQYERVDKTTTVEIKEATKTISKSGSADIVFVVDRSLSMKSNIDTVRDNVNKFVDNLANNGVTARFGLATFSDELYGRTYHLTDEGTILTKFGDSYFTSNPDELKKALAAIELANGGDPQETSTPALNQIVSTYDWSKSPKNKRFAVLLSDYPIKEHPSIPTIADTIATLNANGIERIVATSSLYQKYYKGFTNDNRILDLSEQFGDTLTKDVASLIVETVTEGHNYKVTKDNYQFYLERRTTLPIAQTGSATPTTTVPVATAYKKEVAKLPDTGSNDTANYGIVGLGLLMAGLGLTVRNRKSKEQ